MKITRPICQPKIKPTTTVDDSDDDKPLLAPKAKAKAKAKPKSAVQKERARQQTRKASDSGTQPLAPLIEEALPKQKQRAKVTANAKDDDAKNILQASKKAAARPKSRVERFIIADPPVSQRRKAEIISDDAPFPRQARPRVK